MSTERWERTKQILEEALRIAPEQRPAYLDLVCGADSELRDEVESLTWPPMPKARASKDTEVNPGLFQSSRKP